MAFMTHAVRDTDRRRLLVEGVRVVSDGQPPRETGHAVRRDRPIDAQVWNWAESAVLSGYGPGASSLL